MALPHQSSRGHACLHSDLDVFSTRLETWLYYHENTNGTRLNFSSSSLPPVTSTVLTSDYDFLCQVGGSW